MKLNVKVRNFADHVIRPEHNFSPLQDLILAWILLFSSSQSSPAWPRLTVWCEMNACGSVGSLLLFVLLRLHFCNKKLNHAWYLPKTGQTVLLLITTYLISSAWARLCISNNCLSLSWRLSMLSFP